MTTNHDKHDALSHVDISADDIAEALRRPSDFGYSGDRDEMFSTWSLGPIIETCDSSLLDQANAQALKQHLEEDWPELADDWEIVGCNHWAVRWVDHLSFRAVEADGTPTTIFRVLTAWNNALSDYPVADDDLFSRLEHEAALEAIELNAPSTDADLPEGWPGDVFSWLWEHDQRECEDTGDGQGACPSTEAIERALTALGFIAASDAEET